MPSTVVAAAVVLVVVAGCTPDTDDARAEPSRSATAEVVAEPEPEPDPEAGKGKADTGGGDTEGTTAPTTKPGAPTDPSAEGPACLVGTWEGDNAVQESGLVAALLGQGLTADATVTGSVRSTYDGATITTTYTDQVAVSVIDVEGSQLVSTTVYDGVVVGRYTATDTELVLADLDTSALELSVENVVDGTPMDMTGYAEMLQASMAGGGTATYTCTADTLVVVPVGAGPEYTTELHRV